MNRSAGETTNEKTKKPERTAKPEKPERRIVYPKLFWLFVVGSLLGCVGEGLYCWFVFGYWQTHVVSVWGPFCILYGIGAVAYYVISVFLQHNSWFVQFLAFAFAGDFVEYVSGMVLKDGLGMEAWNYREELWNINGLISLPMTVAWGAAGVVFMHLMITPIDQIYEKIKGPFWQVSCLILSVFLAVDFAVTAAAIIRWSKRHWNPDAVPKNKVERVLDTQFDDRFMAHRFIEWKFLSPSELEK